MVTCQQPPSSPLPLSRTEKLVTGAGRAAKARVTKRCRTPAVAQLWGHHQLREEKPPAHRHRSLGKARSCSRVIDLSPADIGHTGSHGASPCAPAEAGSPDPFLLSSSSGSASGRTPHTHTHAHAHTDLHPWTGATLSMPRAQGEAAAPGGTHGHQLAQGTCQEVPGSQRCLSGSKSPSSFREQKVEVARNQQGFLFLKKTRSEMLPAFSVSF